MKFRKNKKDNENTLADYGIPLRTKEGRPITHFPEELLDNLRRMVTRIHYKDKLPKIISLTSAIRQEGVTYISWAMGATIAADLQKTVCVVELNWWFPTEQLLFTQKDSVAAVLNGERKRDNHLEHGRRCWAGLAAVLNGERELDNVRIPTNIENLSLLPAGHMPRTQRTVWARSRELQEVVAQLSEQFDYVLLDVPAVRTTSDAIPLASLGDACSLVVRQGVTNITDVRLALDDIAHLPVLGVIMNFVAFETPSFITKFIPQA